MTLRIGSLFSGYGGLDLGVQAVIGGDVVWHVEFDEAPSKILKHHWPDTPNYGDITAVDWSTVPPVDVLTGGFPCQDVSLAGARKGLTEGTRSGLWSHYAEAIRQLKPELVVIENVRGLLSATAGGSVEPDPWGVGDGATRPVINALGAVLGNLADLGYDAEWCGVRAADAGAPHGRYRIFILAHATRERRPTRWPKSAGVEGRPDVEFGGAPAADTNRNEPERWGAGGDMGGATSSSEVDSEEWQRLRNAFGDRSSVAADTQSRGRAVRVGVNVRPPGGEVHPLRDDRSTTSGASRASTDWGAYEPAIKRWEAVIGRVAPAPITVNEKTGSHRLSAHFVEWMMGLPVGHVTDPAIGLTRNQQLKALGNGVVPQQAALALAHLLQRNQL